MIHGKELEKFNGLNFKRWQQKMLFYLTILNLVNFLSKKALKLSDNEFDFVVIITMDTWNYNNVVSKKYILNRLDNTLDDVYGLIKNVKIVWEALDKSILLKMLVWKKFIVSKFLNFQKVDLNTIIS
jgi:asparagine synthetase A